MTPLRLDGNSLGLADLAPLVAAGEDASPLTVEIDPSVHDGLRASRAMVEGHLAAGDVVYGLTTGFGKLKSEVIPTDQIAELQRNLVLSHSVGVGEPMPLREVRIAQVLRLNSLLRGVSGGSQSLGEHLAAVVIAGFVPVVPQQGSVGASGDLATLSHMAAAMMGYGEAGLGGRVLTAREARDAAGLPPLELEAKEGLALINGTEIMKASAVVSVHRAQNASKAADAICALTLEALKGTDRPFQDILARLKNNEGQRRTAANVRACLAGSEILKSHAGCNRVQDPYSLRCVPQIHGAVKTALLHVTEVITGELNAVTDNPLVVPETGEVFSAGLFHGQPLSVVLDYLGLALCTFANVSERRIEQLVNPSPGNVDGETIFQRATSGATAVAFTGDDVSIAAAGDPFGAAFAVIDGTTEALPTGDVIYEGHYTVAAADQIESHGDLSLQFGFSDNSLTGTSDDTLLTVTGVVDNNGVISGSVDFDGTDKGLNGGIYGSNADEVAAGFTDTYVGGYIYGERQ